MRRTFEVSYTGRILCNETVHWTEPFDSWWYAAEVVEFWA